MKRQALLMITLLLIVTIAGCISSNTTSTTSTGHKITIINNTTTQTITSTINMLPGVNYGYGNGVYVLPSSIYTTVSIILTEYSSAVKESVIYSTAHNASFWMNAGYCGSFDNASAFLKSCGNIVNFAALYNNATYPVTFILIGDYTSISHVAIIRYNTVYDPFPATPIDYYTSYVAPKYGPIAYIVTLINATSVRMTTVTLHYKPVERIVQYTTNGTTFIISPNAFTKEYNGTKIVDKWTRLITVYDTTVNGVNTTLRTGSRINITYCTLVPPMNTLINPVYPVNYYFTNCTLQILQPINKTTIRNSIIVTYSNGLAVTYR